MSEEGHIVVIGVAGSGKSTIADLLAARLGWTMAEGDDFHTPANIAKMASGAPLEDDDRWEWLESIRDWLGKQTDAGRPTVLACSALRRSYRDVLRGTRGGVVFLHLEGTPTAVRQRMEQRSGHFMPVSLLPAQFALLEPLEPDEPGVSVSIDASPEHIVDAALEALGLPIAGETPP